MSKIQKASPQLDRNLNFNDIRFQTDEQQSKNNNNIMVGKQQKRFVNTESYLVEIENKYNKKQNNKLCFYKTQTEFTQTIEPNNFAPEIFQKITIKTPQNLNNKSNIKTLEADEQTKKLLSKTYISGQIIQRSEQAQKDKFNHSPNISDIKLIQDFNIPYEISLSKGVSERGFPLNDQNTQTWNQDKKQRFIQLCTKIREQLPTDSPARLKPVVYLCTQANQLKVHENDWNQWIKSKFNEQ